MKYGGLKRVEGLASHNTLCMIRELVGERASGLDDRDQRFVRQASHDAMLMGVIQAF
jgi:hypothetical protein